MKKNLTLIAFIATALLSSCGNAEKTVNAVQAEKPKVKIAQVQTEAVEQLEQY